MKFDPKKKETRRVGGVRVLETPWKPHKSKEGNFLEGSYTQKKSAPKKKKKNPIRKKIRFFFQNPKIIEKQYIFR